MELKKLMVDTKSAWIDYPGLDGFSVEVVNLSRKELTALRKRCTTTKFDRKTRQPVENLDEDKFVTEFSQASIKGWKGLTLEHLETLLLINSEGLSIDLSTCVSAAKLNIATGLYIFKILFNFDLLLMSSFINL